MNEINAWFSGIFQIYSYILWHFICKGIRNIFSNAYSFVQYFVIDYVLFKNRQPHG